MQRSVEGARAWCARARLERAPCCCQSPGQPASHSPAHPPGPRTSARPAPGFGTILSTAFIHMLLPAQMNLSSPCLPESWTGAYEAWAYLFVVLAIVAMQLIDYLIEGQYQRYLERRGGAQPHSQACHEQAGCGDEHTHHAAVVGAMMSLHSSKAHLGTTCTHAHDLDHSHRHDAERGMASAPPVDSTEAASEDSGASPAATAAAGWGRLLAGWMAALRPLLRAPPPCLHPDAALPTAAPPAGPCAVHGPGCETLIKHQHRVDPSQVVGIYMMEAGIIFHSGAHSGLMGWARTAGAGAGLHGCRVSVQGCCCAPDLEASASAQTQRRGRAADPASSSRPAPTPALPAVLIGITLGVTAGEAFNTLLIALSFHQFFEGFAIGSAVVDSGMGAVKSMLMGLAYSVTTPIGIAVGEPAWPAGRVAAGGARRLMQAAGGAQALQVQQALQALDTAPPPPHPTHPPLAAQASACARASTPTPTPR